MLRSVATSNGGPSTRPETGASTGLAGIPSTAPGASPETWFGADASPVGGAGFATLPGTDASTLPWADRAAESVERETVRLTGTLAGGGLADVVEHAASEPVRINARLRVSGASDLWRVWK